MVAPYLASILKAGQSLGRGAVADSESTPEPQGRGAVADSESTPEPQQGGRAEAAVAAPCRLPPKDDGCAELDDGLAILDQLMAAGSGGESASWEPKDDSCAVEDGVVTLDGVGERGEGG
eukprot:Hpha_TRINITY_DN15710_c2_g1::TRINITY_DN15710_c2_g1_i1::g.41644::m.41644